MTKKKSGSLLAFIFSKQFLKNFCIALAVFIVIAVAVLQWLRFYTNHGESIAVPNLKGVALTDAVEALEDMNLTYAVIDSVYQPKLKPGVVVEQTPVANEKIKTYRTIYLVINTISKPMISLPDVRDLSYRNAKATLEAVGFRVTGVEYIPSEYKDLVKNVKAGGKQLSPGMKMQVQSGVVLVVGRDNSENSEIPTPSFRGLKYEEALALASNDSLNIRTAQFDDEPLSAADSAAHFVYKQNPITDTPIRIGNSVTIWLTKDKNLLETPEKSYSLELDSLQKRHKRQDNEIDNWFQ
ncbi:MAG: PASTA domain-containing protein [Prevotellaceae bacterium]|jgi:beta-lactam-binding protein with PASTA domain|nr:PASTA domain-containing protein [Prevotellaceae bacterium]